LAETFAVQKFELLFNFIKDHCSKKAEGKKGSVSKVPFRGFRG